MIVEVNGIKYQKVEENTPKSSKNMNDVLMTGLMLGGLGAVQGMKTTKRKKTTIDLVQEYKLILQKKSKLSRRERDSVVYQFNRQYKKIEQ